MESPIEGNKKQKIILYVALGVLAVLGLLAYFIQSASRQAAEKAAIKQLENVSAALEQVTTETPTIPPSANPIKNLAPTANPIEKTNPFNHEYKNPFE
ncbi:MAG: hypothetical protein AAB944_00070 [Patescibacteria group bacterium]